MSELSFSCHGPLLSWPTRECCQCLSLVDLFTTAISIVCQTFLVRASAEMKFGKLLQSTVEEMPEMSEVFLRYRELKKQLKRMPHVEPGNRAGDEDLQQHLQERLSSGCPAELASSWESAESDGHAAKSLDSSDEQSFIDTLSEDLNKLNEFFMNREEDIVIRLQDLEDRSNSISTPEEQQHLKSAFVKLHGEMVLLLHWSLLNFAAVVKILKKHDKHTGIALRGPVLSRVLQQPFYSTESITKLEDCRGQSQAIERRR